MEDRHAEESIAYSASKDEVFSVDDSTIEMATPIQGNIQESPWSLSSKHRDSI